MADTAISSEPAVRPGEKTQADASDLELQMDRSSNTPAIVPITDRFGNTFHIGNAGDYWHPPYPVGRDTDFRTHVRKIRELEIRPDDVLLCSFPKTGTHWHMEIIRMLLDGKAEYVEDSLLLKCFVDLTPAHVVETLSSPRLLITHVPYRHIPKQALEKKIKIIYLTRNPKDVLVSFYHQIHNMCPPLGYPGKFEHFFYTYLELGLYYGDFIDHHLEYQKAIDNNTDLAMYISAYEDMKADPVGGVKRLNQFLGTGCSDQLCEDIAAACNFKALKAAKDAHTPKALRNLFNNGENPMFRKGTVGDWRNHFTPEMDQFFDTEYQRRTAAWK